MMNRLMLMVPLLLAPLALAGDPIFPPTRIDVEGQFLPDSAMTSDQFGDAIVMSDDYIVFGARGVDVNGLNDAGRVYVYDANTDALLYTLDAPVPQAGANFGAALAIGDGMLVVGAHNEDGLAEDTGAVYVFNLSDRALLDSLALEDGGEIDRFGFSLAVEGDRLFVGVVNDSEQALYAGSVKVFDLNGFDLLATIYPDDPHASDSFGYSLAANDRYIAVGATRTDVPDSNAGSVYIFDRVTMQQVSVLQGSDTAGGDEFGNTLAITDARLFVGAELNSAQGREAGSVYVFDLPQGQEIGKLVIPENETNANFGSSLAVHDGYVVVGARRYPDEGNNSGAVFLFDAASLRLDGQLQVAQLHAGDQLGNAVAIHHGRILAAAVRQNGTGSFSGVVYDCPLGVRRFEDLMLQPCDPFFPLDRFGGAMAIDANTMVVGAAYDRHCGTDGGTETGVAYVFDLSSGETLYRFSPTDLSSSDQFGYAVAISDAYIAVSAPLADGLHSNSGAVYVYDRLTGAYLRKIIPDPDFTGVHFGTSVDIDGQLIAIGAKSLSRPGDSNQGGVYTFDLDTAQLVATCIAVDGNQNDQLGTSVDLCNGIVAAGAPFASGVSNAPGAVYMFDAYTGEQLMKLYDPDIPIAQTHFGQALAYDGQRVVVAAPYYSTTEAQDGKVHIFDAASGQRVSELTSPWPQSTGHFGWDLSLEGDQLLVGMNQEFEDTDNRHPSATLFDLTAMNLVSELVASRGETYARYGYGVELSSDFAVVGMVPDRNARTPDHSSAAFVYHLTDSPCPADFNADGVLNFFDVSAFIVAFSSGQPSADYTGDGTLNFFDVSGFIVAYTSGCP